MNDESPDTFDRLSGALDGLPDVVRAKPATVRAVTPLVGNVETFIVETVRQAKQGDFIFIEHVTRDGSTRHVLPPKVANLIARQRAGLTAKSRSKAAKAAAQDRKDRGVVPFAGKARRGA